MQCNMQQMNVYLEFIRESRRDEILTLFCKFNLLHVVYRRIVLKQAKNIPVLWLKLKLGICRRDVKGNNRTCNYHSNISLCNCNVSWKTFLKLACHCFISKPNPQIPIHSEFHDFFHKTYIYVLFVLMIIRNQ